MRNVRSEPRVEAMPGRDLALDAPFLHRIEVADRSASWPAMASYCVSRLAVRWRATRPPEEEIATVRQMVADLPQAGGEAVHLRCILDAVESADDNRSILLTLRLLHYAEWLADHSWPEVAIEVSEMAAPVCPGDRYQQAILQGRLHWRLAQWAQADVAYTEAATIAGQGGEKETLLRARLGLASIDWGLGNLGVGRQRLERIIHEAQLAGCGEIEAHAWGDLAAVLLRLGFAERAACAAFRSHRMHSDPKLKMRMLGNFCVTLAALHRDLPALHGLRQVVAADLEWREIANAKIEMMVLEWRSGSRAIAQGLISELLFAYPRMLPSMRCDFRFKLAELRRLEGRERDALKQLEEGKRVAIAHRLFDWQARLEAAMQPAPTGPSARQGGQDPSGASELTEILADLSTVGA